MDELGLAARLAVGTVFLAAGLLKLRDRDRFVAAVRDLGLPVRPQPVAAAVVTLEVLGGAALLIGVLMRPVAGGLAAVTLAFSAVVIRSMVRGQQLRCHCFGASDRDTVGWLALTRNALLIGGCVLVAGWAGADFAVDGLGAPASGLSPADALGVLVATSAGLVAVVVAGRVRELWTTAAVTR